MKPIPDRVRKNRRMKGKDTKNLMVRVTIDTYQKLLGLAGKRSLGETVENLIRQA